MNGFDTAELLRVNFPEVKIVLFSSGDYSSEERSRALEIGAEFLPKPVELAQVRRIFG